MINIFKTGLLFFVLTGLFLGGGFLIAGERGLYYALFFAGIMNFVGYFFSDKIALAMMRAEEVGPDHKLYRIVEELARRAELPMPRVYLSPAQAPNAFATGRSPNHAAVCATAGLLEILTVEEVAGVMGHELAHVKHRDILLQTIAATIAGAIMVLSRLFFFGGGRDREGDGHPLAALLMLILGPLAAGLIQAAISRQREYAADTGGAAISGDPHALASALEKIHAYAKGIPMNVSPAFNSMFIAEPLNAMETIGNLFSTHPPLEKRIANLLGHERTR